MRYLPVADFSSLTIFLLGVSNASATAVVLLGTVFPLPRCRTGQPGYVDLAITLGLSWRRQRAGARGA